jgi:hypothetical protein
MLADSACTSCHMVGCSDETALRLQTTDGTWPDGDYVITITANARVHECELHAPADVPSEGFQSLPCRPKRGISMSIGVDEDCESRRQDDSIHVSLDNTPPTATVAVVRDGVSVVEQEVRFGYLAWSPNGASCGPTCRSAEEHLLIE